VVVAAPSTALADAAATRIGNEVDCAPAGIDRALRAAGAIAGLSGVLIIRGDRLGALGGIELVGLD